MKRLVLVLAVVIALGIHFPANAATHTTHHARHHRAVRHVAQDITVWVNLPSGIYHYPGTRWYGRTEDGEYMKESQAIKDGYRAAENGQ